MLILAALYVITLEVMFHFSSWFITSIKTNPTPEGSTESEMSHAPSDKDSIDPRDPRFYNVIMEEEALKFRPCSNSMKAASITHSKISIEDRVKRTYNIREEIRAIVTLHDGYDKRKYSGGDQLRATIENRALDASAPCVVTDNNDGTHAVTCEALWSGTSTINVTLAYTRETITTIYRMRTEVLGLRIIDIVFERNTSREVTTCHSNDTHLLKLTSYTDVCNLTDINNGMSFFCGKPKDKHLQCQDIQLAEKSEQHPYLNLTKCEDILFKRRHRFLKRTIAVEVRKKNDSSRVSVIDLPSIPCSVYNISPLWQSRRPTGFFYGGKWNRRNCLGFQKNDYSTCLKNRRLYIFGDSTSRDWFIAVLKRFKCQQITEK